MNESSSLTSRKMAPIKITIIEGDSSDLLPVVVLLAMGGRTPASPFPFAFPFPEGFKVGTLEDLLRDLASEGSDESERMRAYRDARGPKTTGATEAGDDTPPDEPQGSEREPEGTAETPEDTRLRFYFQHEGED
jgi:hypothetical protein